MVEDGRGHPGDYDRPLTDTKRLSAWRARGKREKSARSFC